MNPDLESFLLERGFFLVDRLGRGHSSHISLVRNGKGKLFVAKAERPDSTRFRMAERESENLEKANSFGIGPGLVGFDAKKRVVLMEFVEGETFSDWLFSNPSRKQLYSFVEELLRQAACLDRIGLDHGQLAGRGKNILVRHNMPVIIDFEKASFRRKCHNLNTVKGFLFRNPKSAVSRRVRGIFGKIPKEFTS